MLSLHLHPEDTFEMIRIGTYSQGDRVGEMVRSHYSFCQVCAMSIFLGNRYAVTRPPFLLRKLNRLISWTASSI